MEILLAWEKGHPPLDRVLEEACAIALLPDQRDRQLTMSLVYGTVRWQGWLDQILGRLASHPLAKMKPLTRIALRVGLYQLLFMDRVPASAAINETVLALKQAGQPKWITGFVNGVLRSADRGRPRIGPPNDAAAQASHPAWLVERWQELFGPERTTAICRANNEEPPLTVRVASRRLPVSAFLAQLHEAGIPAEPGQFAPEAVRITDLRGPVSLLPGFGQGLFQVQDEVAQLVVLLLAPFADGCRCLDTCAGLGGKTVQLAGLLPPSAHLTAVEPNPRRLALLAENLQRLDRTAEIFQGELQAFVQTLPELFDAVLVDAPCSGLGVIRRQPDIRWARTREDLERYQARQLALLSCAAALVVPGGVLVYATCSIDPQENEAVITAFLDQHPDYVLTPAQDQLPEAARCLCDRSGFLRTTPEQGLDGFFAARLIKMK